MLIDWLTLRYPLDDSLGVNLHQRLRDYMGVTVNIDSNGVEKWRKHSLDIDTLRSDCAGLFWSITGDGKQYFLNVGASPASIEFDGLNVFGSPDVEHCAKVLLNHVSVGLGAILPHWRKWQCRRLDITANYDMGSPAQVKQALRLLLATDAPRRRTNSDRKGGDSVYWNPSSDLKSGKAYHKGAHLRFLKKKGGFDCVTDEQLDLADNLLRLELKLGSRWFRRLRDAGHEWQDITLQVLKHQHHSFFKTLVGDSVIEVNDMGTLLVELQKVCPTPARALAVHKTFALIKTLGYTQTQHSIPRATFFKHCVFLRAAGLSSADLCAGKVLELRMKTLLISEPVTSWEHLRARKAA